MKKQTMTLVAVVLMLALVLAGCSGNNGGADTSNAGNANNAGTNNAGNSNKGNAGGAAEDKEITLAYVAWDSEIASTNVVREVLESKLGYTVEMLQVDAGPMYVGISDGSADAMVAAWLPSTHGENYYEPNKDKFEDLGPNLEGTKTGLVVPAYMDIASIEDLQGAEVGETVDYTITGIEPGAGIMSATATAIEAYDLSDWNLLESSSAAMATVLKDAYANEDPVIVTGWTPHWMFAEMDLKYLDDPQEVFGGEEHINTLVRLGLQDDHPDAYTFLDQFAWEASDMEAVMIDILNGASEEEAAAKWVEANSDKVDAWLEGIEL
ncbi:glycine betaine ABC transporter substrate-binding protein [Paenibacillus sp. IB182496]|uniref:Glycine betaine ABC transporter substrate-binding protein n=1 Tax=Paenibacillus sabuli TaxID=2772509 RepID=A0A927BSQ4_9BACL|nr:glycine betaine ABC transporter substrate-binding protein [Paenibacillus sabuli]MBD2844849.1 glycine betaine ABC transporter substrate-binding protein [Paenibacillus sabuli]